MGAAPKIKMTNVTRRMIITIAKEIAAAKEIGTVTAAAMTTSVVLVMIMTMIVIAIDVEEEVEEAVAVIETIDTEMIVAAGVVGDLVPWREGRLIVLHETGTTTVTMIDEGTGMTTMTNREVVEVEAAAVVVTVEGLKEAVVEATLVADKGGEVDHLVIDAPEMMRSLKMISFPPTMDEVVEVVADALEEEVGGTHINAKDTTTMMRVATMEVTTTNTVVTTTSMAGTTMQMVTTTMVMEVMAGGLAAEAGGAAVEGAEVGVAEVAVEDVAARQQLKAMKLEAMRANRMRPMILELKKAPRQTMLLKRLVSIPPQWFKQVLEDEEGAEEAVAEAEDEDGAFTEVEGAHFLVDLMLSI